MAAFIKYFCITCYALMSLGKGHSPHGLVDCGLPPTTANLSQDKFAALLGVSVKTLHNWEQGRRRPSGAARVLLRVAARHPELVLEATMV